MNHYAKQLEEKHWQDAASTQEYAELITKQLQELDEILEPLVAQGLVARPLADSNQDREAAAATMRVDSGPILGAGSGSGARVSRRVLTLCSVCICVSTQRFHVLHYCVLRNAR